jgi:hypothetical protein
MIERENIAVRIANRMAMRDPKRMRTDPELGGLLRIDLDVSAKRPFDYDVERGFARHLALIGGSNGTRSPLGGAIAAMASIQRITSVFGATVAMRFRRPK